MKVYILGAGAMGTLYGSTLLKHGHDVIFLDGWQTLLDKVKEKPFSHLKYFDGTEEDIPVKVFSYEDAPSDPADFIIVTVKSSMTEDVMSRVYNKGIIGPETMIMTFQGGFENPEIIAKYMKNPTNCLPAYTCSFCKSAGIMSIENFRIQTSSVWPFGQGKNFVPPTKMVGIVEELDKSGLCLSLAPSAVTDRWKLLVYYPTNIAVSAITSVNFGDSWSTPEGQQLLINLAKEVALIAKLDGIDQELFNEEISVKTVGDFAISSPTHAGSMLQDLRNKRITEIDGTNGALVRRAEFHKIDIPYTRAVWALIRTIECNYSKLV